MQKTVLKRRLIKDIITCNIAIVKTLEIINTCLNFLRKPNVCIILILRRYPYNHKNLDYNTCLNFKEVPYESKIVIKHIVVYSLIIIQILGTEENLLK